MKEQKKYKLLKYDIQGQIQCAHPHPLTWNPGSAPDIICIGNMKMLTLLAIALYIQVKIICTIHW